MARHTSFSLGDAVESFHQAQQQQPTQALRTESFSLGLYCSSAEANTHHAERGTAGHLPWVPHTFLRSARSGCLSFFIGRTCPLPGRAVGNQEHWSFVRHTEALLASTATTTTVQLHVHVRDGCTAKRRTAAPDTEHSSLFQLHFRLMWPKLNMTAQTPSDTEDAWHARSVGSPYSALQNLHVAPGPGVVAASVAPRAGLPSPPSTAPHILQGRGGREKQKCSQGTTSSTCNVMLQSCSKCRITKCLYVHSKLTGNTDPSAHTAVTQHAVDARSVSCFSLRDLQSKS